MPFAWRPDAAAQIVQRVAEGETLTSVCKSLGLDVPSVWRWTQDHKDFDQQLKDARMAAAHVYADMAFDILAAPLGAEDKAGVLGELGKRREMAQHLRWRAAKAMPQVYSERQQVDLTAKTASLVDVLTAIKQGDGRAPAVAGGNDPARNSGIQIPHSAAALPDPDRNQDGEDCP